MTAPTINTEECIACGACAEVCPNDVIVVEDVAKVVNPDDCIECGSCIEECPSEAITL
ncbi:DUF362 domain-containing protein [Curtanaerobium respiraculi]|uniref:DUF362 domain-containing protein n=1 Tax=Curtanaerobium respiraculi TaxID=2949669 RepID=UPI0024B323FC|nr:4Fe-4S binding protein [Curtanaerobium respiraculi]